MHRRTEATASDTREQRQVALKTELQLFRVRTALENTVPRLGMMQCCSARASMLRPTEPGPMINAAFCNTSMGRFSTDCRNCQRLPTQ
jgi:hypothetical protein